MNPLMGTDWHLDNAEERARDHPRTFFIPPREVRAGLKPGDTVKLVFLLDQPTAGEKTGERMWVEVVDGDENGYRGKLVNQPSEIRSLTWGDVIPFRPEHVAAIDVGPVELGYGVNDKAIVGRRLAAEDARPGYLFRDEPTRPGDSGWQLLKGDETDEELNDPSNAGVSDLGFLTDKFPELALPFREGNVGEEWIWDEVSGSYRRNA